ncbi:MAG: hypothetical protein ABJ360_25965 [Roseobacter sp.]
MPGTLGEQSRGIKVELNCAPTGGNIRSQPNADIAGKGGSSQTGHSGTISRMTELSCRFNGSPQHIHGTSLLVRSNGTVLGGHDSRND